MEEWIQAKHQKLNYRTWTATGFSFSWNSRINDSLFYHKLPLKCEVSVPLTHNEVQATQTKHDYCPNIVLVYGFGLFYNKTWWLGQRRRFVLWWSEWEADSGGRLGRPFTFSSCRLVTAGCFLQQRPSSYYSISKSTWRTSGLRCLSSFSKRSTSAPRVSMMFSPCFSIKFSSSSGVFTCWMSLRIWSMSCFSR